jgi:uncharacterized protein YnzC (UPF0291/DUF896 family)
MTRKLIYIKPKIGDLLVWNKDITKTVYMILNIEESTKFDDSYLYTFFYKSQIHKTMNTIKLVYLNSEFTPDKVTNLCQQKTKYTF